MHCVAVLEFNAFWIFASKSYHILAASLRLYGPLRNSSTGPCRTLSEWTYLAVSCKLGSEAFHLETHRGRQNAWNSAFAEVRYRVWASRLWGRRSGEKSPPCSRFLHNHTSNWALYLLPLSDASFFPQYEFWMQYFMVYRLFNRSPTPLITQCAHLIVHFFSPIVALGGLQYLEHSSLISTVSSFRRVSTETLRNLPVTERFPPFWQRGVFLISYSWPWIFIQLSSTIVLLSCMRISFFVMMNAVIDDCFVTLILYWRYCTTHID